MILYYQKEYFRIQSIPFKFSRLDEQTVRAG